MSDWIEIRARLESPPDDWSPLVSCCEEFGCPSSLQTDNPPEILAYLEDTPSAQQIAPRLRNRLMELGATSVEISSTPEEDWTALWKLHFKAARFGKRIVVCPTWEDFDAGPEDVLIMLDPGQAFGTGDHATTSMCLELLDEIVVPATLSVLDVGTGSGILSIAACKLGAAKVLGTDIDPVAVDVARVNAARNEATCEFIAAPDTDHPAMAGPWQLIVSNIISATLIRLAPELAGKLESGGTWVVSGILASNWNDVRAAGERCGLSVQVERTKGDWVAAAFKKP